MYKRIKGRVFKMICKKCNKETNIVCICGICPECNGILGFKKEEIENSFQEYKNKIIGIAGSDAKMGDIMAISTRGSFIVSGC